MKANRRNMSRNRSIDSIYMKNSKYILMGLAVSFLMSAGSASAETQFRNCADIGSFSRQAVAGISERARAAQNVRLERMNAVFGQWARQDAERTIAREEARRMEEMDFTRLEELLANAPEAQKRALAEFKAELQDASKERRMAIDVANERFRANVRLALESRSRDFHSAATEFASSVQGALETYPSWCLVGAPPAIIRENVATRLRSAREGFESDPRAAMSVAANIRAQSADYKAEIHAATERFRARVTSAQAAFKAALEE